MSVENYRIAVCGGGGVGKSCLTIQFVQNQFVETWDPTIEDSYQKQIKIEDTMVMLDILDTAGQEEYKALRDEYMRTADGFVLVFDLTNRKTFDELNEFHKHIVRCKDNEFPPLVIAANKCDCNESDKKVTETEIQALAAKWRIKHLETSAKLRLNVDQSFHIVVNAIMAQKRKPDSTGGANANKKQKCTIV
ncbi:Ras family GTPase [Acrasis kona]|uniref:small monomeric GTPase n=1 Tax=Acrasis kona TaxID=1008807 RepID=A0AAW2ZAR8_9EUKA